MKATLSLLIVLLLLCDSRISVAGPFIPSRCVIYAPQFRQLTDTAKGTLFLRQQGIWGDLSKGFNSAGDRFYWSISTGGLIQFVEWENAMLYLVGDYEMAADQHSDIYFHPRGIFWTEGVMFGTKIGNTEFHTGYINRCHHDIDNLENNIVGAGEQRTLIYSSLLARSLWRDVTVAGIRSDLAAQFDYYVFKQDYLTPVPKELPKTDAERIIASISGSAKFDLVHIGDAVGYARLNGEVTAFNRFETSTVDGRVEIGIQFFGEASAMNVYLGFESLQDDFSRPIPMNSHFVYLGFRFLGRNIAL
ncbi:MAG: hypothetical protein WCH46_10040 [bacterium]